MQEDENGEVETVQGQESKLDLESVSGGGGDTGGLVLDPTTINGGG
jgi:hypothetical protein